MGKLKGTALQTVKDYVTSVRKSSDKNVYFVCRSNDGGVAVREVIRTVFKPETVTRYNYNLEPYLTLGMSKWKEFRAKFNTKSAADECYKEVNAAINASYNEDPVEDDPYVGGSGGNNNSGNGNGGNSILGGNSTYIIIGAAAIIILLILWNSKRK